MLILSQDTQERISQESLLRQRSLFWLLFFLLSRFALSVSHALSLCLSLFATRPFCLSNSLYPPSLSFSLSNSFTHTHTLSLSPTHWVGPTHFISLSLFPFVSFFLFSLSSPPLPPSDPPDPRTCMLISEGGSNYPFFGNYRIIFQLLCIVYITGF